MVKRNILTLEWNKFLKAIRKSFSTPPYSKVHNDRRKKTSKRSIIRNYNRTSPILQTTLTQFPYLLIGKTLSHGKVRF